MSKKWIGGYLKRTLLVNLLLLIAILCAKAEVVFNGEHNVGSWDAQQLPVGNYAVLEKAAAGDLVAINVTAVESGARITLQDIGWNGFADEYDCAVGMHYFVLSASDAAKLNEGGLIVTGEKYTFDRVELLYRKILWQGTVDDNTGWGQSDALANGIFAALQAGDMLGIDVTAINDGESWHQWAVRVDYSDNLLSGTTSEPKTILNVLTAEQVSTLQTSTVNVIAQYLKVSGLYTYVEDKSTLLPITLSVPVTDGWVFSGMPSFTIHVDNDNAEVVTCHASVKITTDKFVDVITLTADETVASNDNTDIVLSASENLDAGFYRASCLVNGSLAREFVFAVNPTDIVSASDKQEDFDTFWATAKNQLDAIDMDATLTEIPSKSTSNRKVYLVELKSIPDGLTGDPVTIRGYYCEPQDGKKHPVIIHYQGYDSGYRPGGDDVMPYCPSGDAEPDYAEFILSTRGQSVNNRPASERADGINRDFTNTYGDWFAFNFGNKDSYYYRGAYMDAVRAIDFMASRETSDMDNLYAEGQSQGGALTYAAASLSGRTFKAIAPAITFMGDFPDYFEIANWPASVARENQGTMTDGEMYAFLSYFDTKNLATLVSCPVITSVGLQDNVCPPHTNIASYNNVTTAEGDKQVVFNPELQHQTNSEWYTTYMNFFENYQTVDEETEVIWTGGQETGDWSAYVDLSYDNRGNLSETFKNDMLRITFTTTADGAQIQLSNPAKDWAQFSDEAFANVENTAGVQTFEYAVANASVLEDIQLAGIIVAGKYITITKVELVKKEDRYDAVPATIGVDGIATFSSSKHLSFANTGITPYYASEATQGVVTMTSIDNKTTWGYQGYILRGAEGSYDVPVIAESEATYPSGTNYLKATSDYATDLPKTEDAGKYLYIFAKYGSDIGFYHLANTYKLAAHCAYLCTDSDIRTTGAQAVAISFDDELLTGIQSVTLHSSQPHIFYTLSGQRVAKPTKGIYVSNGKKVIVK